jgi:outer membrane protein
MLGMASSRAETIDQALALAYQNNPQLNSQRAVVRATDETVPQALSGYRPTVIATGAIGEQWTNSESRTVSQGSTGLSTSEAWSGLTGYTPSSVGVTVRQTLHDGLQTANRTRLAESNTSAAREVLRVIEQTVLVGATTAYMDVLRDGALLQLQRRNVEVLQEQVRQARVRFDLREVTRTDVAQAESRLALGRAAVLGAQAQYAKSKASYRQVIGVEVASLTAASPVDRLLPSRLVNAIETARSHHPNVGIAMFGIDGAVLQVKINAGLLYPTVGLVGGANYNWESDLSTAVQQFNAFAKAQISVPIYQGGSEYALIRQAKETVAQKRFDLDAARDAVQQNVVQTWAQLEAAKAQIQATQAQVAAAEVALNGVREEARSGQRTTLDVLNAQQELVNARSALVIAQHDRVVASYTLLAAVGQLNLPKLGIRIALYDPVVHYQQVRDAWVGIRTSHIR